MSSLHNRRNIELDGSCSSEIICFEHDASTYYNNVDTDENEVDCSHKKNKYYVCIIIYTHDGGRFLFMEPKLIYGNLFDNS